jgi:Fe2+ transport system protein FeoA
LRTVNKLKPGESGIVLGIVSPEALKRRIIDMGITPGAVITVKKMAPFGDPIEICIRGYHLSIGKKEASKITVEKTENFLGEKVV